MNVSTVPAVNTTRSTNRFTQDLARPRAYQVTVTAGREQVVDGNKSTGKPPAVGGGGPRRREEAGSAAWRPAISPVQQRLNRLWRLSIFILFLVLLATIVHIVQFFVPSGVANQLYANVVQGNRASVREAPETPFIIRPFFESNPEQSLSEEGVLLDDQAAVYTADVPRGRGFVKRKNERGAETVYAVSAMHQLRCLFLIQSSFTTALLNASDLDVVQRRNTYHCIELLRQAVRCGADPTLDPAFNLTDRPGTYASLGWGSEHICRDYEKLYDFAVQNRADDSTGLDVDYGFTVG